MKAFRTRYSLLVIAILVVCTFILIWKTFQELPGAGARHILWMFFILIGYLAVVVGCLWTHYIIDSENKQLVIRTLYGLSKRRIEIMNISKIKKTNSMMSSPALSFRRIRIYYIGRFQLKCRLMISPVNQDEFIAELKKINPDIEDLTKR